MCLIALWACLLSRTLDGHCWEGYGEQTTVWIIIAPMILALLVNYSLTSWKHIILNESFEHRLIACSSLTSFEFLP